MSEDLGKQFREEAIQSLQSGQAEQALELINQAIELNQHDSESHVLRGISLAQLQRTDEATEAFRNAIACGPSNPKAYFNLAVHQYSLGQKVEAETMAKEAIRLDPTHAGAKDLVGRIQRELNPNVVTPTGSVPSQPSNPADPLSAPQQPSEHPMTSPTQPNLGPGPAPGEYYRPGYNTQNVHSLQFVENMGSGWDMFGYILSVVNIVLTVVVLVAVMPVMMEAFNNPQAARAGGGSMWMMAGVSPIVNIMSWVNNIIRLITLVWMILELADRRGNWLWLLPFIICCCCGFPGVIIPLYIWKGRS